MVTKETKYRIGVNTKVGPFKTSAQAAEAKRNIKAKVPRAVFSATTGKAGAYYFTIKRTYVKSIAASASIIKEAVRRSAPHSTVTVIKV